MLSENDNKFGDDENDMAHIMNPMATKNSSDQKFIPPNIGFYEWPFPI